MIAFNRKLRKVHVSSALLIAHFYYVKVTPSLETVCAPTIEQKSNILYYNMPTQIAIKSKYVCKT